MWGTALKKTSAGDVGTALKNLALSGWRVMTVGDVDTALRKMFVSDVDTALGKTYAADVDTTPMKTSVGDVGTHL